MTGYSPRTTRREPFEPSCPRCGDLLIVGSTVCPSCYAIVTVIETRAPRDFREPVRSSVETVDNGRDDA
jgi:hypothetical protein